MIVLLIGLSGSGKTTQSKLLSEKTGISYISMGQMYRDEIQADTFIGKELSKYVNEGSWVPYEVTSALIKQKIESLGSVDGLIIDGSPRRIEEAVYLDEFLQSEQKSVDSVVLLQIPEEIAINRLKNRQNGREDDNDSDIEARLNEFKSHIDVIKSYYKLQGKLIEKDGTMDIETIFTQICAKLRVL